MKVELIASEVGIHPPLTVMRFNYNGRNVAYYEDENFVVAECNLQRALTNQTIEVANRTFIRRGESHKIDDFVAGYEDISNVDGGAVNYIRQAEALSRAFDVGQDNISCFICNEQLIDNEIYGITSTEDGTICPMCEVDYIGRIKNEH